MDIDDLREYLPEGMVALQGPYNKVIPALRRRDATLVPPAQILDWRNQSFGTDMEYEFWDAEYLTDVGLVTIDETLYVFPDCERLRRITARTKIKISEGGIPLRRKKDLDDAIVIPFADLGIEDYEIRANLKDSLDLPFFSRFMIPYIAGGNTDRFRTYLSNGLEICTRYGNRFTINIGFYDDSSHPILRPLSIDIGRVGGLMFVYYLPGTSNRTVAVGSPPGVIARDLPRYRVQNQEQSVPIIQEPIQLERTIEDVEREISERIRERFRNLEYEKPE